MNFSEEDRMMTLKQAQDDILQKLLPAIVALVMFCLIGLIGNLATIIFFAKRSGRSSTFVMITSLAAVDLAVCIAMIFSIWELSVIVTSYYSVVCKMTHFLGRWSVSCSCFVLWIISIDRYRKICKPFEKQVTIPRAKQFVAGFIFLSLLLSIKELVHYSSIAIPLNVSYNNQTIKGYYCKEIKDTGYKISISVFNAVDMILFVTIWATQIVVYSLIIYNLVKIRNKKTKLSGLSYTKQTVEISDGNDDHIKVQEHGKAIYTSECIDASTTDKNSSSAETIDCKLETIHSSSITLNLQENISNHSETQDTNVKRPYTAEVVVELPNERFQTNKDSVPVETLNAPNKGKSQGPLSIASLSGIEMKLTLMLFTVSLIFILCFTPYFVMVTWAFSSGKEFELDAGIKFAIRLPFLNSIFNPIIYFAFNADFRSFIKRIIC